MNPARGIASVIVVLLVVASLIVGAGAILGYQKYFKSHPELTKEQDAKIAKLESPPASPTNNETANWKTYVNSNDGFSFKYPSTVTIKDIPVDPSFGANLNMIEVIEGDQLLFTSGSYWIQTGCSGPQSEDETPPDWLREINFQISDTTITSRNFCGTHTYFAFGTSKNNKTIHFRLMSIDKSNETLTREILKTVTDVNNIRTAE